MSVTTKPKINSLESLRGIAAVIVLIYHLMAFFSKDSFYYGYLAVDFFFVLSGFVLTYAYREHLADKTLSFGKIFLLRVARLFPVHVICLIFMIAVKWVCYRKIFTEDDTILSLGANLLLLQNVGFYSFGGLTWNVPSWSISTEFWGNALVFFLWISLSRRVSKTIIYILPLPIIFLFVGNLNSLDLHHQNIFGLLNTGLLRCVMGFCIGSFIHDFWSFKKLSLSKGQGTLLEICVLVIIFSTIFMALQVAKIVFVLPFLFGGLIYIMLCQAGFIEQFLSNSSILKKLGAISYSLYLIHFPIIVFFEAARNYGKISNSVAWSCALFFSFTGAFVLKYLIEDKIYFWIKKNFIS